MVIFEPLGLVVVGSFVDVDVGREGAESRFEGEQLTEVRLHRFRSPHDRSLGSPRQSPVAREEGTKLTLGMTVAQHPETICLPSGSVKTLRPRCARLRGS